MLTRLLPGLGCLLTLSSEAPLTQEEQSAKELRDTEISAGSNFRRPIVSTGLAPPISEEAVEALKEVKPGGFVNLVQLVGIFWYGRRGDTDWRRLSMSTRTKKLPLCWLTRVTRRCTS